MDGSRPFRIVTGVMRELLRSTGKRGIALGGEGPEANLLSAWMSRAGLPLVRPPEETIHQVRHVLGGVAAEDEPPQGWARAIATLAIGLRDDLLAANAANKTVLVLTPNPPLEAVLPMGDLYAHEIRALEGDCTLPACLLGTSAETLDQVDRGLKNYLESHAPFAEAFQRVDPPLREVVRKTLEQTRRNWHSRPLVPKLTHATLGVDLDL